MVPFLQNREAAYWRGKRVLNGQCKRFYGKQDGNGVSKSSL